MKMIYKTMDKSHKNYVILSHDTENDMYYVSYKLYKRHDVFSYTHYNHACYMFNEIHNTFKDFFPKTLLTNVK